jgi:hypothetical protein
MTDSASTKKRLLDLRDKNRALLIIAVVSAVSLAFVFGMLAGKNSLPAQAYSFDPHPLAPPSFGALAGVGVAGGLLFLGLAVMYMALCSRNLSIRVDYRATDDEREILAKAEARRIRDRIEVERIVDEALE